MKQTAIAWGLDPQTTADLRCPQCGGSMQRVAEDGLACGNCGSLYPVVGKRPILFSPSNKLFDKNDYLRKLRTALPRRSLAGKIVDAVVPGSSVNLARERVLALLLDELDRLGQARTLVVGVGREKRALERALLGAARHELIGVDVDVESDADIFCDAHELPFADESFDAVVTTAVLEHVCDPIKAIAEIRRVLRPGGLVYSEIPFMQQVHAGAHDFTRYTRSGHIGLFGEFEMVDAGLVAGPGTALVWSIENFFKLMFSRTRFQQIASIATRTGFFWLKYFDYLMKNSPQWLDGASCTYFYGRKSAGNLSHVDLVNAYVGSGYKVTYRAFVET